MRLVFLDLTDRVQGTLEVVGKGKVVATGIGTSVDTEAIEPGTFEILEPADGDRWLQAVRHEYRGQIRAVIEGTAQKFNPYHEPGGSEIGGQFAHGPGGDAAARIAREKTTPPPKGRRAYSPDPHRDADKDGITDASRVGVAGDRGAPSQIPRLPNLTRDERAVESRFADAYERNPNGMVERYLEQVERSKSPNTFATDDAKLLSPDYAKDNDGKARYNVAVHQTANAVAKAAFEEYVRTVVAELPENKRTVLFTAGGCAAGKGFALSSIDDTKKLARKVGAVWDSAGEQNGTELHWALHLAQRYGARPIFIYVDGDPMQSFDRVIERAAKSGRMVDAGLFADSYTIGAKNFSTFHAYHELKGDADFIFVGGRKNPKVLDGFPEGALRMSRDQIYRAARAKLSAAIRQHKVSRAMIRGGLVGTRIWGSAA